MGVTAWFLWDRLDPDLQNDVAEMVVFHADRIAGVMPGARVFRVGELLGSGSG